MHEPFDPYWHWLAIPPAEQPPDHYRLLGLSRFEGDTQRIAGAAQSRIDHVRNCDDGRHPESVERVLEHLAAARDTLLNPTLKAQYDYLISQQRPAQAASASRPTSAPATSPRRPTAAPPRHEPAPPAVNVAAGRDRQPGAARPSAASLIVCGAAAALALALGLALWLAPGDEPGRASSSPADRQRQLPVGPDHQATSSSRPERNASGNRRGNPGGRKDGRTGSLSPDRPRRPRGPETMADLMGTGDDTPADAGTVTGKLAAARRAMWSRNLGAARRNVDAALQQARTSTERDETQRLGKLLGSLEAFWAAVREGMRRLEGAEELCLGDRRVLVVEADQRRLIVRDAGRNVTYAIEDLPRQLALALAMRALPNGQPATNLYLGSFLAVDKRGDRQEARRRWQQAGPEGTALVPELALAPPPELSQPEQPAPSPVLPSGMDNVPPPSPPPASMMRPPTEPPPVERAPVPEAGALAPAEQLVEELFEDDLKGARTAEAKRALSQRLFDVARQTDDDPAACYVLCRIARDLAVEVGDPDSFCPVIDELDRRYQVDGLAMKAEAFAEAWRSPSAAPYRPALARQSLDLLQAAIEAKRYAAAEQFLRVAQSGARAAKDYQLIRELEEQARQIKASLRGGG